MAEETTLTAARKNAEKPSNIFTGALRMVKGENTHQLIEEFTSEMTLVAEGLCEDQSKLRREMDQMARVDDRRIQAIESKISAAETSIDEERNAHDRDMTEVRNRLAALEKKANHEPAKGKKKDRNIIRDLTWLVGIAAASWIIVTVINKFF